jgi:MFS family permease
MLSSMALMTVAMFATAMLPTYAQIGPLAGVLLIALRCLMSFSVGGEYTGVVAYLLEGAKDNRRGLITSCASAASEIGALMAAGAAALTVWALPEEALVSWGWRLPFLFGAALAALVLITRAILEETPEFLRQCAAGTVPKSPIRQALTRHRSAIARGFAISALGSITYYVGITYVPAFLDATGTMPETRALSISVFAALTVILVTPLIGLASDRFGRRPLLLMLALGGIGRQEHHAQSAGAAVRGSCLGPHGFQIAPGDPTEHPGTIAGITITTAATAVLHAVEAAQGLLQHPVTGLTLQAGQETHAAGVLLACNRRRCGAVAMGPNGARGQRHNPATTFVWMYGRQQ